jgi:Helix-turn-helix domain
VSREPLVCQVIDHLRAGTWPAMPALQRLVLMLWAGHGDPDGSNVYPSQDTIATEARASRSTVEHHTHALRDLGVLVLVRERGSGQRTDLHAIALPDLTGSRSSHTPDNRSSHPRLDRDLTGTRPAPGHNHRPGTRDVDPIGTPPPLAREANGGGGGRDGSRIADYPGECIRCGGCVEPGDRIYVYGRRRVKHVECPERPKPRCGYCGLGWDECHCLDQEPVT